MPLWWQPDCPDEWARIEELGGPISRCTDGRVRINDHLLTTTRAIGKLYIPSLSFLFLGVKNHLTYLYFINFISN